MEKPENTKIEISKGGYFRNDQYMKLNRPSEGPKPNSPPPLPNLTFSDIKEDAVDGDTWLKGFAKWINQCRTEIKDLRLENKMLIKEVLRLRDRETKIAELMGLGKK